MYLTHPTRLISRIARHSVIITLIVTAAILLCVTTSHSFDSATKAGAGQRLKTIIVNNYHPYTFINDRGQPDGFSVEIAKAVTKAMDLELEIRADKWDVAMKELEAGKIDLLPMMAYSQERDIIFDFSVPHTIAYDTIFIRKGSTDLRTLKNLSGKTVIVMNKDIAHSYLLSSGLSKTMTIYLVDSLSDALKQLASGIGDAAIMPKLVGLVTVKNLHIPGIETSPQLIDNYTRPFSFAVKDGNQALLERLNQGLNIIKSTGQYDVIYKKWFGALEDPHLDLKTAIMYASGALLIIIAFIAWNVMLKRQVSAKTKHLEVEIAERKQVEETIKVRDERLRAIMDNTDSVIYMKDIESKYITINRRFEELFKVNRKEALGKTDYDIFPAEIAAAFQETDHTVFNLGKPLSLEEIAPQDDGIHTYASIKFPLLGADGKAFAVCGISNDITERKKAEESLAESEYRWKFALEGSGDGVWDWNILTSEAFYSRRYKEILGFAENEIGNISEEWSKRIHPEDAPGVMTALQPYLDGKTGAVRIEFRMLCKDGSSKWIVGRGTVVSRDSDGIPLRMIGTITDITGRKQEEEQIKSLTQRLLLATSSAHLGVWDWNVKENTMVWDDRMFELYGITRETFSSNIDAWMYGLHPDDKETAIAECQAALHGDNEFNTVFRVLHPDGAVKYLKGNGLVLRDADGKAVRMIGINADITEHKNAEEAQRQSEAQINAIFETSSDAIAVSCMGRHIVANPSYMKMFGYSDVATLKQRLVIDLIAPSERKKIEGYIQSRDGQQSVPSNYETIGLSSSGEEFPMEVNVSTYTKDNELHTVVVIRNITERKRAEEEKIKLESQLYQSQKMESIGSLAGGVAHDFNNKLSVILGCTYMAFTEEDQAHRQTLLDEVRKAAEQSADLTRQLLTFASKQTISTKILDLNETVSGMLKMLHRLLGEDIKLNWQPAADLWLLKLDPSQIDQVLANLCVNARDSITTDGMITIETLNCVVDIDSCVNHPDASPGKYVRLLVSDNGSGMGRETLDRIFEPFFTTKEPGKGTGLGLATVFGIVKQNNGFINVYSEPGQGTTFSIYFPRHVGKSSPVQNQGMAIDAPTGKETILLVEDELAILNMASMILTKHGYTVLQANTPGEAIRLADEQSGNIDLLITDVVMPEMNGKELAHKLMTLNPILKCIFISGYTADAISQHVVLDEGVNFIQKPFSLPDLAVKVREVLDGK